MDKTVAGLLGAVGALVASTTGQAATPASVLHATSYAELLRPISDPVATLRALEAAEADDAIVENVQYYGDGGVIRRDHHHHHRVYRRQRRRDHHHHHHHNGYNRY